jgi:hypothetical protein
MGFVPLTEDVTHPERLEHSPRAEFGIFLGKAGGRFGGIERMHAMQNTIVSGTQTPRRYAHWRNR